LSFTISRISHIARYNRHVVLSFFYESWPIFPINPNLSLYLLLSNCRLVHLIDCEVVNTNHL
jgi:hypothetical protein